MNYNEAIEYIHSIPRFVRPLGNDNLGRLLSAVGDPQKKLKFVHVAGTNGKGSVCAMTAAVLTCSGYKTGLFTSPYIEVFNERIQIDGKLIPDDTLAEYTAYMAEVMEREKAMVSEFAFITAVAVKYFFDMKCDIVILETGMGGRLDATNIIGFPECAVLTSIGMDHMQYLGNTIEEIAGEKCGIIKPGCEVVSAPNARARRIIERTAADCGARLTVCDTAKKIPGGFIYKAREHKLSLGGQYQAENGSVVIETLNALRRRGWRIGDAAADKGMQTVKWQARYELAADNIIIDGAHNIDGIRALKKSLAAEGRDVVVVLAMMRDKSYEMCIQEIVSAARLVIATELDTERSLSADEIKCIAAAGGAECIVISDVSSALKKAVEAARGKDLVCVCGSLYLAGEVKRILKKC